MVTHDIDYHLNKIQKRLRRKVHPGWYLCGIFIAVLIVASQYGDTLAKMLTRR